MPSKAASTCGADQPQVDTRASKRAIGKDETVTLAIVIIVIVVLLLLLAWFVVHRRKRRAGGIVATTPRSARRGKGRP